MPRRRSIGPTLLFGSVLLLLALVAPVGSRTWSTCIVCGRTETSYAVFGWPIGRIVEDGNAFTSWFDREVHVAHEHDWTPGGSGVEGIPLPLVIRSLLDPGYEIFKSHFCIPCSIWDMAPGGSYSTIFQGALLAIPVRTTAAALASQLARASHGERIRLLQATYWARDQKCPEIDERLWEPLEEGSARDSDRVTRSFASDYEAWLSCHPEWR